MKSNCSMKDKEESEFFSTNTTLLLKLSLHHTDISNNGMYFLTQNIFLSDMKLIHYLNNASRNLEECSGVIIEEDHEQDFLLVSYASHSLRNKLNYCKDFCCCHQLLGICVRSLTLKMDVNMVYCCLKELENSEHYRRIVIGNIYATYRTTKKKIPSLLCSTCNSFINVFSLSVEVTWPQKQLLDKIWNHKIQVLVTEQATMENAMAWLSTLGGAYSALGDQFQRCAIEAGRISMQQLKVALRLGEPLLICRCRIFIAMSLLQLGYLKDTKHIICCTGNSRPTKSI
ncbi:uncharacterized protein LOC106470204 isoform X2 [Limulus polyphemus]|uniref:Uncharacterized protein LOC106470204 isoform X2 n=1 Tax=Limulus polyphemus TaxID=6850 RepID=A0ABM1TF61_LIMPO|nr:uncharacterized protein LOC106470204 isoform X2 [Limulus polyphemus]